MNEFNTWLSGHAFLLTIVAGVSAILLIATIVAAPWAVSRLPANYLLLRLERNTEQGIWYSLASVSRALLGFLVTLLGVIMLVTPGPGVIIVLLGISIAQFPGRDRLLIYLATRPNVLSSLNWMRKRHGKPPFIHPHGCD